PRGWSLHATARRSVCRSRRSLHAPRSACMQTSSVHLQMHRPCSLQTCTCTTCSLQTCTCTTCRLQTCRLQTCTCRTHRPCTCSPFLHPCLHSPCTTRRTSSASLQQCSPKPIASVQTSPP